RQILIVLNQGGAVSAPFCARPEGYHCDGLANSLLHCLLHCGISALSATALTSARGHQQKSSPRSLLVRFPGERTTLRIPRRTEDAAFSAARKAVGAFLRRGGVQIGENQFDSSSPPSESAQAFDRQTLASKDAPPEARLGEWCQQGPGFAGFSSAK